MSHVTNREKSKMERKVEHKAKEKKKKLANKQIAEKGENRDEWRQMGFESTRSHVIA